MDAETGLFANQTWLIREAAFEVFVPCGYEQPQQLQRCGQEKTLQMTQGRLCKCPLLLLCLHNGFLSSVNEAQVPPTHTPQFFLPSLFLLFLLPRPSCTYTYAEQTASGCVRTSHPPTGELQTDTLMTLHSNQSSFPASDLRGAAIVAAACNIQSQSKGEINDLSASRCAGG